MEKLLHYLEEKWEKKIGGISFILILSIGYFFLCSNIGVPFLWYVEVVIISLALLIWMFVTRRLIIPLSKYTIAVFIKITEDEKSNKIKHLVYNCTKEIKKELPQIRILLFPLNYCQSKTEIDKYFQSPFVASDLAIFLELQNGNLKVDNCDDYVVNVVNHSISGKLLDDAAINLYKTDINLKDELFFRKSLNDWIYIESNSFNDRKKWSANLKDFLLFSIGVYLLCNKEIEQAVPILKSLYLNSKPVKVSYPISGVIRLTNEQFLSARLANILMNALFVNAIQTYYKNDKFRAYRILKECDTLFPKAFQEIDRYVTLARVAYECGDMKNAVAYTDYITKINGGLFFSYLNKGFFAIVNEDISALSFYYNKICNYANTGKLNAVETVAFLEDEKERNKSIDVNLLNFAEAILTKLFIDDIDGNQQIDSFISEYGHNSKYYSLVPICNRAKAKSSSRYTNRFYHGHKKKKR